MARLSLVSAVVVASLLLVMGTVERAAAHGGPEQKTVVQKTFEPTPVVQKFTVPAPVVQKSPVQTSVFQMGPAQKGVLQKGPIQQGVFQKGVFQKGPIQQGVFQKGPIQQGVFQRGVFQKGPVQKGGVYACCPEPCVRYVQHRPCRKTCCGCLAPMQTVLVVPTSCGCCTATVPVCLPGCCTGVPLTAARGGLFGRQIVNYQWCCGYKIRLIVDARGDITVHSYGA